VPEPPTTSADITIVVPATVAIPSTKSARFAALIALTRWPDENALPAVIINVLFPDPIKTDEDEVMFEYPGPVAPVGPIVAPASIQPCVAE
jgi:hypothetical protein